MTGSVDGITRGCAPPPSSPSRRTRSWCDASLPPSPLSHLQRFLLPPLSHRLFDPSARLSSPLSLPRPRPRARRSRPLTAVAHVRACSSSLATARYLWARRSSNLTRGRCVGPRPAWRWPGAPIESELRIQREATVGEFLMPIRPTPIVLKPLGRRSASSRRAWCVALRGLLPML